MRGPDLLGTLSQYSPGAGSNAYKRDGDIMTHKCKTNLFKQRAKYIVSALALTAATLVSPALAQAAVPTGTETILIQAQPLESALNLLAQSYGKQIIVYSADIGDFEAPKLSGVFTEAEAFNKMLAGSDVGYIYVNARTIAVGSKSRLNSVKGEAVTKAPFLVAQTVAQDTPVVGEVAPLAPTTRYVLDEIIVTADKRSESIQDVPISITAFNGDEMRSRGMTSTLDLEDKTLGLNMTLLQSEPNVAIRGIGSTISGIHSDPTVGLYNEGVYQARPVLFRVGFYDVDRVEVLKGPQGTLYGRNTTGGVVNVVTNDPTDEFEGYVSLATGSFNLVSTEAAINLPFNGGALRLAGTLVRDDGYTNNLAQNGGLDSRDSRAVRAKLRLDTSENLSMVFAAEYVRDNGTPGAGYYNSRTQNPSAPGDDITDPNVQIYMGFPNGTDPRNVNLDGELFSDRDVYQLTSTIGYDFGSVTLKSISGLVNVDVIDATDTDGTAADIEQSYNTVDSRTFSQEFQLSNNNPQTLEWIAGLYYFTEDSESKNFFRFSTVPFGGADEFISDFFNEAETDSYGAYLNIGIDLRDQWKLTLGGRYSHEKKAFQQTDISSGIVGVPTEVSFSEFTPRVVLEYTPSDNVMAYGSVTNGFKSGGLSYASLGVPATAYDPENLWAYEAGIKSTLLDDRMQLNLAAFYYDFKNLQLDQTIQNPVTGLLDVIIGNSPDVTIKGIELEGRVQLSEAFRLTGGLAYTKSELPSTGTALPHTPKWGANFGAEYVVPLSWGELTLHADMSYQSTMLFPALNNPAYEQSDGYALVDAGLVFKPKGSDYTISLVGRNLADKEVLAIRGDFLPFNVLELYAPPRTWELRVTAPF
ncbi:MAG: hypothetical protein COA69_03015 [Robiginitomaculum sp.]|nr:MAG: hypothetical protein COA69_03015 [Robiginitomaculum sp.]